MSPTPLPALSPVKPASLAVLIPRDRALQPNKNAGAAGVLIFLLLAYT
jgi:hypothetical protein